MWLRIASTTCGSIPSSSFISVSPVRRRSCSLHDIGFAILPNFARRASRMRWSSSFFDFDHPEYPPVPIPKNRFRPTTRLRFCRMAMTASDMGILCSHLFLVRDRGNVIKLVLKSVSFTRSKAPISSRRCRVNISKRTISL